jgi:hypothetical protein
MTCLIGLNLGAYAMIGADTMIYHPTQITYAPKILRTPFGLIAGSGLTDLIDNVVKRLADDAALNVDHVRRLIIHEFEKFSGPMRLHGGFGMDLLVYAGKRIQVALCRTRAGKPDRADGRTTRKV